MLGPKEIVGQRLKSAGRAASLGAASTLAVRVARAIHGRWWRLSAAERKRLEPLADDVRERALDLRGAADPHAASRGLRAANEKLADAMVECAEDDPGVDELEVRRLRDELSRELDRLACAAVEAERGPTGVEQSQRAPSGSADRVYNSPPRADPPCDRDPARRLPRPP